MIEPYAEQVSVDSPFINSAEGHFSFKIRKKLVAPSCFSCLLIPNCFFAHHMELVVFSTGNLCDMFFGFFFLFSARKTFQVLISPSQRFLLQFKLLQEFMCTSGSAPDTAFVISAAAIPPHLPPQGQISWRGWVDNLCSCLR